MTPIDVGTTPLVICLSMCLFQDSHIPDVFAEFDTASGESRASSAVSPTVGQPLVLSAICFALCLQQARGSVVYLDFCDWV
ncbi:flocculation protein FLO11-like [Cucumis melo var. makuwa]|uniref:Flocculation protein FLO11-like n=1 Tax=Cucumis melo var. makuwa TaxID=1194695 RepID=A0A5D3DZC4_CUCMM|nr:flocculation protein FLO11-like [Cucumis melo var. makuwa]TYK29113.1 flocculation protein FLO11-like [Cucumis melo var. makuwa]